jgi:hypothetical protein
VLGLPRRLEHPLDVTVQRSHYAYAREHRRPVMLSNQQQRLHRGPPFFGVMFGLRQFGDVFSGVAVCTTIPKPG